MQYFSSIFRLPSKRPHPSLDIQLEGPRVLLRLATGENWRAWRSLRELSRDFLVPWEPQWPYNCLSQGFYNSILRRQYREWRNGTSFAFTIFVHDGLVPPYLVGGITLSDVQYAEAQKGTIGYWMGKPYSRHGLMSEAIGLVCDFAFDTLQLQRVEASCLPRNEPSKALLTRMGFEQEGYAKAYLQINGKREDHLLWGKANPGLAKK